LTSTNTEQIPYYCKLAKASLTTSLFENIQSQGRKRREESLMEQVDNDQKEEETDSQSVKKKAEGCQQEKQDH